MSIIAGYLLPHAPVFIEAVGGHQTVGVKKTIEALKAVADEIKQLAPDLLVMISPHGPIFSDAIAVYDLNVYEGDMKRFGEFSLHYHAEKDGAFLERLIELSNKKGGYFYPLDEGLFRKFQHEPKLDHGITVPYHFISAAIPKIPILPMSYGTLSYIELMRNGELIKEVAETLGKRVIIIASGDMSHALKSDGPYAYHEDGPWFDERISSAVRNGHPYSIFTEPYERIENASECGLRSFAVMMGALNGMDVSSKVWQYEGPFGVGYLVAGFNVKNDKGIDMITKVEDEILRKVKYQEDSSHTFVQIARRVICDYVKTGKPPKYSMGNDYVILNGVEIHMNEEEMEILKMEHGVFVSIKKYGTLRGCIGTIMPSQESTFVEIVKNAISACSRDYRFDPITMGELDHLSISVDVLSALKPTESVAALSPKKFGVVVHSKGRHGVLLPDLAGIDTTEEQLKIASNKGGFSVDEIEKIECFTVERYH